MHCEVSVDIPAPIERVWQIAQDPATRPRWDLRVARYEVHGPQREGAPISLTLRVGPLRPTLKGELLRWAPPQQSVMKTDSASSPLVAAGAGSWTFTPTETGTRLTSRFTLDESKLHALLWKWLYRKAVEWDTRRSFRRLKAMIMVTVT